MQETRDFTVIGHRGFEGRAPPNSMEAINLAIEEGIDMVEFDVRRTADGVLVLQHDATIKSEHFSRPLAQITLSKLRELESRHSLVRHPTAREVLEACRGRIKIQVELKAKGCEKDLQDLVKDTGFPVEDLYISSFRLKFLKNAVKHFEKLAPHQLVYLVPRKASTRLDPGKLARKTRGLIRSISIFSGHVNYSLIQRLRGAGYRILAYGLPDRTKDLNERRLMEIYSRLLASGVDGFTCAFPDVVKKILRERRPGT